MAERHFVRMAQAVVSRTPGDVLVSLGLGSCIGLALVDPTTGVAGLAHIVLPTCELSSTRDSPAAKHADTAVPALLEELIKARACRASIEAVLCGGASMFTGAGAGTTAQIGHRNARGTRLALAALGIQVRGEDTGGNAGRSIEVDVATGVVSVRTQGTAVTL
jgi:chemotaxis protein CheD